MIFKRNSEADTALFTTFNKVGWGIMAFNAYTLFPYFYDILKGTAYWQRIFATSASIALIIGIEASVMTVIFDPRILLKILDKPKIETEAKQVFDIVSFLGIATFLLIAAYTFWTDYQINLKQLGNPSVMFVKVLCAVFVIGAELAFGCANIFYLSSKEGSVSDSSRR
jgi:uncharacterized membrane protein